MLVRELIISNYVNGCALAIGGGNAHTVGTVTSLWTIQRENVVRFSAEAKNVLVFWFFLFIFVYMVVSFVYFCLIL